LSELVRLSLAIEQSLLERLEELMRDHGYRNRSEFVRDLIRDRLVEEAWAGDRETLATVTLVYDHQQRQLSERLTHLQHHHHGAVLATTHIHLGERLCAEMIMVRGNASELRQMASELQREKGVLHAALSMSSVGGELV
jgi:CopG family nickel-responsive transcriptional regulator